MTADHPRFFCVPREGSEPGEQCSQPRGLEARTGRGSGTKGTGSLVLTGPRPGSSPGPRAAPAPVPHP